MRTPTTFLTRLLTGKFGILCSVTKGRVVLRSPKKQQHNLILNLETSLPGLLNEMALRLMGDLWSSRISAPTGTGALQIAPDPGKPGVFVM